jgi:assimilatory nitrate reductase electron transfer subunit
MVGARFAEEVRRRDPAGERAVLTVIGAESHPAYNRVLLSTVLAGGLSAESVRLHGPDWAGERRVDLRTGVAVTAIDRAARRVLLSDGGSEPYDELVLATGSRAWVPPIDGLLVPSGRSVSSATAPDTAVGSGMAGGSDPAGGSDGVNGPDGVNRSDTADGASELADGVATFRDLDDCVRILRLARPGSRVAVLGGGLLGLEAARGLAGRGVRVTVLHPVGHLMERQLDPGASAVLAGALGKLGVDVRLNVMAKRWSPELGLECNDGTTLSVDAVVVSAGVRPETGLAAEAGIAVDRGVLVDDRMGTSDDRVHAIGDCARHPGTVSGLVQPGFEQAEVLAALLTGADPAARYRGTPLVTRLKARGIDLAAVGDALVEPGDDPMDAGVEVLRFEDPWRGRYSKIVLRDDRLIGAIMLGVPDAAASAIQLFDSGAPAPSDRLALLLGRALPGESRDTAGTAAADSPALLPSSALICRCNTVSKGALVTAWRAGATDVDALSRATRASTGCGSCRSAVAGICDWLAAAEPAGAGTATGTAAGAEPAGAVAQSDQGEGAA